MFVGVIRMIRVPVTEDYVVGILDMNGNDHESSSIPYLMFCSLAL